MACACVRVCAYSKWHSLPRGIGVNQITVKKESLVEVWACEIKTLILISFPEEIAQDCCVLLYLITALCVSVKSSPLFCVGMWKEMGLSGFWMQWIIWAQTSRCLNELLTALNESWVPFEWLVLAGRLELTRARHVDAMLLGSVHRVRWIVHLLHQTDQ